MAEPLLTFPNQLTILRMVCAPVFAALTIEGNLDAAAWVFVLGAITDLFDGLIARRYHTRTELGAILDPVADKIFLGCAFVALSFADAVPVHIPKWLTILVLARDAILLISALAIAFVTRPSGFPPSRFGKLSTAMQVGCVILVFAVNLGTPFLRPILGTVFIATAVVTVGSGFHYLYRASSRKLAA